MGVVGFLLLGLGGHLCRPTQIGASEHSLATRSVKPLDLRFWDYTNEKSNLKGKSLAAALMSEAKFDGADMTEVVMSKAYAVGASFKGTNFSNAVLDR